jgi:hypothetical protein
MNVAIKSPDYPPVLDVYNAVYELATAADANRASQRLHYLAGPPFYGRGLIEATGHRPVRIEVLVAEEYDRRNCP